MTQGAGKALFDLTIGSKDLRTVVNRQSIPDEEMSNRIDVAPDCPSTKLQRLADRRATAHEGIENDGACDAGSFIE